MDAWKSKAAIVVSGETEEKALEEALDRLGLPREAVDYETQSEDEDDLLSGKKPLMQVAVFIKPDWVADQALEHLINILERMEIEAEITVEERRQIIFLNIDTEDASLLIGRNGDTLNALQYLVNRMIAQNGREAPLFIIDVSGYRMRTLEKLEKLAVRAVKRARETGNEIELDPMPPLERKFLHHYMRQEDGVETFSRGQEPERCLVIIAD